jgi:cytochrome P450
VFFHPLSKFPGPKSAAASQIPCALHTVRGRLPHWIKGLHDQFGSDVVRISPRELSFINASAWKNIHGNRPGHPSLEKDPAVYRKPPNEIASLLTADRADHVRMRRVLGHAFSDRASRDQEPVVESYVDILIKRLHEQVEGPEGGKLDISKWFRWLSFDIAGDLSFGESFECLQNQQLHSWANMITGFLKADVCLGACNRFYAFQRILPYLIPKQTRLMMDDHWAATVEKVSRRLKLGARRPDFISPIIKYNEEGKGLTEGEIQSNASLFIVAGSDSVATVLTGTTFYLLQYPEVMRKLTDEVRTTFKTEKEINSQSVARLPYMIACLDETSRIYPTVLTGQAVVVAPEGDMIGNTWIPGGVSFVHSAIHITFNSHTAHIFCSVGKS